MYTKNLAEGGRDLVLLLARVSPDYAAEHAGIWTVNADGTGLRRLVKRGSGPQFTPDGRKLAFAVGPDVYVARAGGSGALRVSRGAVEYFVLPTGTA